MKKLLKILPMLFIFSLTGCVNQNDSKKEDCTDCHIFNAVRNTNKQYISYK